MTFSGAKWTGWLVGTHQASFEKNEGVVFAGLLIFATKYLISGGHADVLWSKQQDNQWTVKERHTSVLIYVCECFWECVFGEWCSWYLRGREPREGGSRKYWLRYGFAILDLLWLVWRVWTLGVGTVTWWRGNKMGRTRKKLGWGYCVFVRRSAVCTVMQGAAHFHCSLPA